MFIMYDSVDISQIPNGPHAIAYYIDGHEGVHTHEQMRARFPHARLLPISTGSRVVTECYDIENGDYLPGEAGELFHIARNGGISRPCMYADLSNMPAVKASLERAGATPADVRLWVAYYNGQHDLPTGYDAHQFTNRALGRNLDESICADTFFEPAKPTVHVPQDIARVIVAYDVDEKKWSFERDPLATPKDVT